MLHARVPSVSDTQQALAQPELEVHTAVQTVPTPVSRTQRARAPLGSVQQSVSVTHGSPTRAKHADWHTPEGEQDCPAEHEPHEPVPHPLSPQLRPAQEGAQTA
jgi:hypothetical protein